MEAEQIAVWRDLFAAIAASLAVAVGGLWTVYTFRKLNVQKKHEYDLETARKEATGVSVVDVDMSVEFLESKTRFECPVRVSVTVTNKGSRHTVLNFDQAPLRVQEILLGSGIYPHVVREFEFPYLDAPDDLGETTRYEVMNLRAQANYTFEFIIGLVRPGTYRANFSAFVSNYEKEVADESGMNSDHEDLDWSGERVFYVPSSQVAPWTDADFPKADDRAITLLTASSVHISHAIDKLSHQQAATSDGEHAEPLWDLLDRLLDLRAALVSGEKHSGAFMFESIRERIADHFGEELSSEIETCLSSRLKPGSVDKTC